MTAGFFETTPQARLGALQTVHRNLDLLEGAFPGDTTTDDRYRIRPALAQSPAGANHGWTTGFWVGLHWLSWEQGGDEAHRDAAMRYVETFVSRVDQEVDLATHDLGFLYTLSCVTAWRLLDDTVARDAALMAAEHLMRRFLDAPGIIQAWGDLDDPSQRGRTIIDSLMNLPLLSWAARHTGDDRFSSAVDRHSEALRQQIVRADGSTFHTFFWDPVSGEPLRGMTAQGAFDDSCWARGQAWGIYGFALNYRATGNPLLLDAAIRCADYFLEHVPPDGVPYWDLAYADGSGQHRDSSASAVAVCGLVEIAHLTTDPHRRATSLAAAGRLLDALERECTPRPPESSDALLLHGVYNLPEDDGVDEGTLWGDYFYLEALTRRAFPEWRPPWWV